MSDIKFHCPNCGGHLVVNKRGIGLTVSCPHCSQSITIPDTTDPGEDYPRGPRGITRRGQPGAREKWEGEYMNIYEYLQRGDTIIVKSCVFVSILVLVILAPGCMNNRAPSLQIIGCLGQIREYSGYVVRNRQDKFEKSGKWTYWHPNGHKSREGCYNNGELHGQWISWYGNGHKSARGSYEHGYPVGIWIFWDENGSVIKEDFGTHKTLKHNTGSPASCSTG